MLFLYNIGLQAFKLILSIVQAFNPTAKLWLKGRKNLFQKMKEEVKTGKQHIWFHFASLGEFEQGRPVLEKTNIDFPEYPIVVTFFSPSGYEMRKNYALADYVYYLPLDTKRNAQRFIEIFNPKLAVFIKYEYWYHFYNELFKREIPILVISAIFRKELVFYKWYGGLHRSILHRVTQFFVQDQASITLLETIGITQATIGGDTRFDRVAENAAFPAQFQLVKDFCVESPVFVAGSTWPPDETLLAVLIKKYANWKFIIAPHEIKPEKIKALENLLPAESFVRYSTIKNDPQLHTFSSKDRVLIIDNIGMLSSLYQYGQIAYIGGGFGVGIHNTLEAAAFGIPVLFGPNYQKFLEARTLIEKKAGFSIRTENELLAVMEDFQDESYRIQSGVIAKNYVMQGKGATAAILSYMHEHIFQGNH